MLKKVTSKKPKAGHKNQVPETYLSPIPTPEQDKLDNQAFWRLVRDDSDAQLKCRLTASELLGKSLAMFTENVNNKHDFNDELKVNVVFTKRAD